MDQPDFSDDIICYLKNRRGTLVPTMEMIRDLSKRVSDRNQSQKIRGQLLSSLAVLTKEKKVIRYRRTSMVRNRPRSSQGFLRISEACI